MPYLLNELRMIYIVEKAFDVNIYDSMQVRQLYQLIASCYGVLFGSVRSESIRMVIEFRFTDWL